MTETHPMANSIFPTAYHFAVSLAEPEGTTADTVFQEVSGLDSRLDQAPLVEGGENRFRHRLPAAVAAAPLTLKRARVATDSVLLTWCRACLEGGLAQPIKTKDLTVGLIGEAGRAAARWSISGAYPIKWRCGAFDAMAGEVTIEAIELAYRAVERTA